jgi:hypothetical protein
MAAVATIVAVAVAVAVVAVADVDQVAIADFVCHFFRHGRSRRLYP